MPNALTHKHVAEEIFKKLPEDVKKVIAPNITAFYIGSLGPDSIMGLVFEKDDYKRLAGDILHTHHIFEGISNAADYFSKNSTSEEDNVALAYYLGFLTHYGTDTAIHPYVYEYIANRMRIKYDPALYKCLHTIVETEMDVYVDNHCRGGKRSDTFWQFKWSKKNKKALERFYKVINKDQYKLTLTRKDIEMSIFFYRLMMFMCQRHKNGSLRYNLVAFLDRQIKAEHLLMAALRPRSLDTRYDYLNMEKTSYESVYGSDFPVRKVNYSFPEQLDNAVERGYKFITKAWEHINGGEKLKLNDFSLSFNGDFNEEYLKAHGLPVPDIPPSEVPFKPPRDTSKDGEEYDEHMDEDEKLG